MPDIVILSGNHLCNNPRVLKEAGCLARAGFDVEVLGAWLDGRLKDRDQDLLEAAAFRFTPVVDLTGSALSTRARYALSRLRNKAGQFAYRFGRFQNRWQLGHVLRALSREARKRRADLFIAHSEPGLLVGRELLDSRRAVGVDLEDWFSEDLPPEARKGRPIRLLRDAEQDLLRRGAHSTCPSRAMSDALAATYGCSPPAVVYNAFPWSDRSSIDGAVRDRVDPRPASIHWFSQTLGPGRGLEDLVTALPLMQNAAEIHLRGNLVSGFDRWLWDRVPPLWRARVVIHAPVPNGDLLSRIAEHDIGFAGEMQYCKSRNLTVTNKILQYLLGGLAVVASDTAGQREVAEQSRGAVSIYPPGDPAALAATLDALLSSNEKLGNAKGQALRAAEQTFCWELQQNRLLESVARAASRAGSPSVRAARR